MNYVERIFSEEMRKKGSLKTSKQTCRRVHAATCMRRLEQHRGKLLFHTIEQDKKENKIKQSKTI